MTSVAPMLASESVQKSRIAHTNATELRENRLAITGNTEKKDVYLSPFHVNLTQLAHGVRRQIIWKYAPRYVQLETS